MRDLFVFGLMDTSTWLRRCSTNGTDHRMSFTKFAPMMGIFIFCDSKRRTSLGIWCHSGESWTRIDEADFRPAFSREARQGDYRVGWLNEEKDYPAILA